MPGNSPGEAVERFLGPIKNVLAILADGHLHYTKHPQLDAVQSATLEGGEGVRVPAAGPYEPHLHLEVELSFTPIVCDDERGPYRCTSVGYTLILLDSDRAKLLSAHWHPKQDVSPFKRPHVHVGEGRLPQMAGLHIPTPRISVEDFVLLAIETFGAQPKVAEDRWRKVLADSAGPHETHRSWFNHDDAPLFDDPPG